MPFLIGLINKIIVVEWWNDDKLQLVKKFRYGKEIVDLNVPKVLDSCLSRNAFTIYLAEHISDTSNLEQIEILVNCMFRSAFILGESEVETRKRIKKLVKQGADFRAMIAALEKHVLAWKSML